MRLIDFARLHWPWRVLFRVLSLSWKLLGSRGPRHHRSSGPALQALASETPDIASRLLPLVTLPILLVARSRCPDPDSNLHRTTYPSPPLRSAQAAQEGQFILRGGGPSDYKIVVSCCTTITADGASNLTWRQGASRARRPAASSSRTCDGAACPIRCWSSPTARPACSARSRMICLATRRPRLAPDAAYFVVLGLNLLLLLKYGLGWLPLRQPQPDLRHVG